MVYPDICWQEVISTASAQLPRLVRHAVAEDPSGGTNFYIHGGMDPSTNGIKNEVYRIQLVFPVAGNSYQWTVTSVTQLPNNAPFNMKPRMDHIMVSLRESDSQTKLFIHGGISDVRLKDIWRYEIDGAGDWTELTAPTGNSVGYLFGHTAIAMRDPLTNGLDTSAVRIWIFGGTDQVNIIRNALHVYNPPDNGGSSGDGGNGGWTMDVTPTATVPSVTQHCAASVHSYCMYIHGGISQYSPFVVSNALWEYCANHPTSAAFTQTRPLGWTRYTPTTTTVSPIGRVNRYSHGCAKADDRLLIFGGRPNIAQPNYANDLIDYDPVLNMWGDVKQGVMFANNPGTLPGIREEHATSFFSFNGEFYMLIFGGRSSSTQHRDLWAINYRRPKCSAGQYSDEGTITCLPCPAGSVSLEGAYQCTNCTAGEYTNGEGDTECRKCPKGSYTLLYAAGSEAECTLCAPGTYSNITGRNTTCDPCPTGTYSTNTTGRDYCFNCPGGTANLLTGSILIDDCLNCTIGYYAPAGSANCTVCPGGTYGPEPRLPECYICPAGTWSDDQALSCTNCSAGTSNNAPGSAGAASCQDCPAGTYAPVPATPYCIECPAGTYSTAIGAILSSTCEDCPLGTYNNETGGPSIGSCKDCFPGSYQDTQGAAECKLCPVGSWNDEIRSVGIADCKDCPAGTYAPVEGTPALDQCIDCETGRYQPVPRSDSCRLCPNGTYNPDTRADSLESCLLCPPDTYSIQGQTECADCPTLANSTVRSYYSMKGWEVCQPCSEDTGYGWVRNGHFEGDTIHQLWQVHQATGSCTHQITGGSLYFYTPNRSQRCVYKQTFAISTESTFPYYMSIKSKATSNSYNSGASWRRQVEYSILLKNGTTHTHTINIGSTSGWTTYSLSHRPDQVNDKLYLSDLYIIESVTVYIRFELVRGHIWFDDVQFSPFSSNMCNCSKVNRDAEYFTIDLFERDSCERCTIGKYCNGAGQFQCPDDTYSFGGYVSCLACAKGLACKDGIATTCGATQFKNTTSNECQDCPLDSSCRNTDRHICLPGTYGQGERHCLSCFPGTYCDRSGCTSCDICPDGFTSNFLRTECYPCPAGHYSVGGAACMSCPIGTYGNSTGLSSCTSCPTSTNTTCVAASTPQHCLPIT